MPGLTGPLYPARYQGQVVSEWLAEFGERQQQYAAQRVAKSYSWLGATLVGVLGLFVGLLLPTIGWRWALKSPAVSVLGAVVASVVFGPAVLSVTGFLSTTSVHAGELLLGTVLVLMAGICALYPLLLAPRGLLSILWRVPCALGFAALSMAFWLEIGAQLVPAANRDTPTSQVTLTALMPIERLIGQRQRPMQDANASVAYDLVREEGAMQHFLEDVDRALVKTGGARDPVGYPWYYKLESDQQRTLVKELSKSVDFTRHPDGLAPVTRQLVIEEIARFAEPRLAQIRQSRDDNGRIVHEIQRAALLALTLVVTCVFLSGVISASTSTSGVLGTILLTIWLSLVGVKLASQGAWVESLPAQWKSQVHEVADFDVWGNQAIQAQTAWSLPDPVSGCRFAIYHPLWPILQIDAVPRFLVQPHACGKASGVPIQS